MEKFYKNGSELFCKNLQIILMHTQQLIHLKHLELIFTIKKAENIS